MIILVPKLFQTKMHSCHIGVCTNDIDVPFTALSPIPLQLYIYRNATNSQAYMVMFDRYDRLIFWLKNGWLYMCMVCVVELVDGVWKRWSEWSVPLGATAREANPVHNITC